MDNILGNNGFNNPTPSLRKFPIYSNLSVSHSCYLRTHLSNKISKGLQFLNDKVIGRGFLQSDVKQFGENETLDISEHKLHSSNPLEIYTSLLALDLLGDIDSCEFGVELDIVKPLITFILPDEGISTFGMLKFNKPHPHAHLQVLEPQEDRPESTNSSSGYGSGEFHPVVVTAPGGEESTICSAQENLTLKECESLCNKDHDDEESFGVQKQPQQDSNTTAVGLSVLLKEGLIDTSPVIVMLELLLSNVETSGVIKAFFDERETIDVVSCANVLYLYYMVIEEMEEQEHSGRGIINAEKVELTEIFLKQIIERVVITGNYNIDEQLQPNFALHPSVDAVLFFLSRCTTVSERADTLFSDALTTLLNQRIDKAEESSEEEGPLNLALRILSADALGLLEPNSNWMKRKLESCCSKLASMQNEEGYWPPDTFLRIPVDKSLKQTLGFQSSEMSFRGKELSTIFACKALHCYLKSQKNKIINPRTFRYKDDDSNTLLY